MEKTINIGNLIAEIEKIDLGHLQAEIDPIEIGELEVDIERNESLYKKATVHNGRVGTYNEKIKVKNGSLLIKKGDRVRFYADVPEGKYFDYWAYPDGAKYSSMKNFHVRLSDMYGDYNLTAVFSDNPIQNTSDIRFIEYDSQYKYTHEAGTNRYYFFISCNILNTYKKKEWGIIYSSNAWENGTIDPDELVLGNEYRVQKMIDSDPATKNSNSGIQSYWKAIRQEWFDNEKIVVFRVYAIIEQNGEEQTIYSDEVITIQLHSDMS